MLSGALIYTSFPLVNSSSSTFFQVIYTRNNQPHSISLGKLSCNLMRYGIKAWQVFVCSYFRGYCSQVEIKLLITTCPGDTQMQMKILFFFFPHHVLTALVLYLLFTRSSSAAHHVVKNINEISLNSIFAPYGFAEAVASLKQSAVPSGHCGFCPLNSLLPPSPHHHPPPSFTFTHCRSSRPSLEKKVSQNILRVSLGRRLYENYCSFQGATWKPDESERLVQLLLA